MVLLELLGIDVQLEAAFRRGLQNHLSCPFADVGVVIQRPGNGADGIPRLGGQVLDCHGYSPSLFSVWEMPTGPGPVGMYCKSLLSDQPFTAPAATPLMMYFWQVR